MSQLHRFLVLVAALALVGCSGGSGASASASAPGSSAGAPAGVRPVPFGSPAGNTKCDSGGHDEAYHIHAVFQFTENGAPADPDSNIGVGDTCMYWVHTHDATGGVVHIEAPADVTITLGDFMDLWASSFPSSTRLAVAIAGLQAGKLTINGQPAPSDWRSVVFLDGLKLLVGP